MKNILLVGGEGYIGNVIAQNFLSKGFFVTSFDNLYYKNQGCVLNKIILKNYTFIHGDIVKSNLLEASIIKADIVVLLAGLVGDPITKKYPYESSLINDKGIKNVIDLCAKNDVKKLIFISTCSNYGLIKDDELADESFELNPLSSYAKSKVSAEKYILSLKGKTKMSPTILRFATAFGLSPRMRFDLTVSEFTRSLALGKELVVYDEMTWRPYCHVQDFSRLIQLVCEAAIDEVSFEVFNAGGDEGNATKQMIVDQILQKKLSGSVKYQENGTDPRNYRVSFEKVKSRLGFEPKYAIDDGISELLDAISNNLFDDVEKNKSFYGNYELEKKVFNE